MLVFGILLTTISLVVILADLVYWYTREHVLFVNWYCRKRNKH